MNRSYLQQLVSRIHPETFEDTALQIFRFQAAHNSIYAQYLRHLHIRPESITSLNQIPFLPIGFFKQHKIITQSPDIQAVFESSGTTGSQNSRHYVADLDWYNNISIQLFEQQYGLLSNFHVLALLPSYLERNNSSLVYMVQQFIKKTDSTQSNFFLNATDALLATLQRIAQNPDGRAVLLWGVTFALLDWAESRQDLSFLRNIPNLKIMETGGMKGRRREWLRQEVHQSLTAAFGVSAIHSEYGMTELLSQAYSTGNGVFDTSPTLRILLRDLHDPFAVHDQPNTLRYGGVNVVDLANIDSCAFVETQDLGRFVGDSQHFEIIGRFDNSDIRGCNLLIS